VVENVSHVVMMFSHVVPLPARYWCQVDSADSEIHSGNFVVPESLKMFPRFEDPVTE
jgi:hypothetical protein